MTVGGGFSFTLTGVALLFFLGFEKTFINSTNNDANDGRAAVLLIIHACVLTSENIKIEHSRAQDPDDGRATIQCAGGRFFYMRRQPGGVAGDVALLLLLLLLQCQITMYRFHRCPE